MLRLHLHVLFATILLRLELVQCVTDLRGDRLKRAVPFTTANKWNITTHIPYILDSQYDDTQKSTIRTALQTMTENTCITFKEDNGPGLKLEYSYITSGDCQSSIGDSRDARYNANHKVFLHSGCVNKYGVMHETIHALGFRHTHTRPDRDEYIKVDFTNIDPIVKSNFDKLNANQSIDLGIPYEYNSLLHYEMYTGVNPDIPALIPKYEDYNMTLGGSQMLFNDWKMINFYYKCNETCKTPIKCQNGGYQHPRKCSECVCPQFHKGALCETERETITLQPGIPFPINYGWKFNFSVYWDGNRQMRHHPVEKYERSPLRIIKAPKGTKINVTINNINDRETHGIWKCDTKALEIVDGDLTTAGKRFCLRDRRGHSFLSKTNVIGWLMYSKPGLNFVANITLTVVGTPTSNLQNISELAHLHPIEPNTDDAPASTQKTKSKMMQTEDSSAPGNN